MSKFRRNRIINAVVVSALIAAAYSFHELGVDARGLVEKNAYPLVEIGGVKFVQTETNAWGSPLDSYEGRDEAAGATAKIQVTRYDLKADDERVASLVKSITFTLTDTGNTDPP